ncbi:hypothetical protein BBW65_02900 [Helicobacter enhydrae]|uniref:Cell division protein ZapA n=1 Tax=Helicobacter enhydrae TaxID=222136 RepID=A0A1B1U552_9HELI|nr:hypothetical protein [Helicobacter enhydrae]ANV97815.1 hypothetical protein BBW65_02900 [Helicobacter enhydrae]
MTDQIQVAVKTKDGTRTFGFSIASCTTRTKEILYAKLKPKSGYVGIEDLLFLYVTQVEQESKLLEKNASLQSELRILREEHNGLEELDEQLEKKIQHLV